MMPRSRRLLLLLLLLLLWIMMIQWWMMMMIIKNVMTTTTKCMTLMMTGRRRRCGHGWQLGRWLCRFIRLMSVVIIARVIPQGRGTAVAGIAIGSSKGKGGSQIFRILCNPINGTFLS
jgi:hypothetical protein